MTTTRYPSTFTLIVLIALASIGAVLFTPALPIIRQQFHVSVAAVQWTVNIFIIGYAVGQLIYGPFANRFGRKPTLYFAITIAFVGSIISGYSGHLDSFTALIVGRLIMALGASAGLALSFTVINDVYSTKEARRVIAYVSLAFAILPGLGIFVGGFIVKHFSWPVCFYFMALYYVFALVLCFYLPETLPGVDHGALHLKSITSRYWETIKNKNMWLYASMWGVCTSIIYIFAATAPIICITKMGLTPSIFGIANLSVYFGLVLGGLSAAQMNKKVHHHKVILLGTIIIALGAVILLVVSELFKPEPWSFFGSAFIICYGMSFVFSNSTALATATIADKATASSVMTFINMGFAVVGLTLMGLVHNRPQDIMAEFFVAIVIFQIILVVVSRLMSKSSHQAVKDDGSHF